MTIVLVVVLRPADAAILAAIFAGVLGLWRYRIGRAEPISSNDPTAPISTDLKTTRAQRWLIWNL